MGLLDPLVHVDLLALKDAVVPLDLVGYPATQEHQGQEVFQAERGVLVPLASQDHLVLEENPATQALLAQKDRQVHLETQEEMAALDPQDNLDKMVDQVLQECLEKGALLEHLVVMGSQD